jgi:hypothetical protein
MMSESAQLYMTYPFAVTKELCQEFLTLASGILIFSITFSEKIVDFKSAGRKTRFLMFSIWTLFILSIISCGLALCVLSLAGGHAVYGINDYEDLNYTTDKFIIAAGAFFIISLILIVIVGMVESIRKVPTKIKR